MRRLAILILLSMIVGHNGAWAVVPTDDVSSCSLLSDPTAQRSCFESARQKRPAATFDPSSVKIRSHRNRMPPVEDATTGLGRPRRDDKRLPVTGRPASPEAGGDVPPAEVPQMP